MHQGRALADSATLAPNSKDEHFLTYLFDIKRDERLHVYNVFSGLLLSSSVALGDEENLRKLYAITRPWQEGGLLKPRA